MVVVLMPCERSLLPPRRAAARHRHPEDSVITGAIPAARQAVQVAEARALREAAGFAGSAACRVRAIDPRSELTRVVGYQIDQPACVEGETLLHLTDLVIGGGFWESPLDKACEAHDRLHLGKGRVCDRTLAIGNACGWIVENLAYAHVEGASTVKGHAVIVHPDGGASTLRQAPQTGREAARSLRELAECLRQRPDRVFRDPVPVRIERLDREQHRLRVHYRRQGGDPGIGPHARCIQGGAQLGYVFPDLVGVVKPAHRVSSVMTVQGTAVTVRRVAPADHPRKDRIMTEPNEGKNTMTTTAAEDWRTHQQPCFCDVCWFGALDSLIGERAVILQAALADRLYADGLERDMADEVIAVIPPGRRLDVLEYMLTWDHLYPRVMGVDCLLDECDERSYKALNEMAATLLAAIRDQGGEGRALRTLITNEICSPIVAAVHRDTTGRTAP
jgi:hypothetical protein